MRDQINLILQKVKIEQSAQFSELIKEYWNKEEKYDKMPTIRVRKKSKELDRKRKLVQPLRSNYSKNNSFTYYSNNQLKVAFGNEHETHTIDQSSTFYTPRVMNYSTKNNSGHNAYTTEQKNCGDNQELMSFQTIKDINIKLFNSNYETKKTPKSKKRVIREYNSIQPSSKSSGKKFSDLKIYLKALRDCEEQIHRNTYRRPGIGEDYKSKKIKEIVSHSLSSLKTCKKIGSAQNMANPQEKKKLLTYIQSNKQKLTKNQFYLMHPKVILDRKHNYESKMSAKSFHESSNAFYNPKTHSIKSEDKRKFTKIVGKLPENEATFIKFYQMKKDLIPKRHSVYFVNQKVDLKWKPSARECSVMTHISSVKEKHKFLVYAGLSIEG